MGLFSTLLTQLKTEAVTDLLKPVNTALDNIISTPSAQNAAGQGAQLLASLIPLLPVLEGQAIKDIAQALKTTLATATAPVPAAPSASSPASAA